MTHLISIIRALMRGHTVACITVNTGARFTLWRWSDVGSIIETDARGYAIRHYIDLADLVRAMRKRGEKWDAAIIDDVKQEQEFLAGREAAAVLIDPPSYIKLAA